MINEVEKKEECIRRKGVIFLGLIADYRINIIVK